MYDVCERREVQYTFGLRLNPVLQRRSDALLAAAVEQYEQTGQPQRLFTAFWYQAGSWALPRWVVVKAEAHAAGTNRRAVVTNRPGATRAAAGGLRRVHRSRRKREPQQGNQVRTGG